MVFSFKAAERLRRQAPAGPLARRDDSQLPFMGAPAEAGDALLLDTCVYIDKLQGKTSPLLEELLSIRHVNHSIIAVQELMYAVGALDPADRRSRQAVENIGRMIEGIPSHRLRTPDAEVLANAAVYAGMLCRSQRYAKDDRRSALNDSVLFLQAIKLGCIVLTRNVRDFDLLLQLRPSGRVLFYRT